MPNFQQHVNGKLLERFTMKPSGNQEELSLIAGRQVKADREFIYLKVEDGMLSNCVDYYDISFHMNRLTFQLQHNELRWMKTHELFPTLINNPRYKMRPEIDRSTVDEIQFR